MSILSAIPISAQAEAKPSLEDTLEFIKGKVNGGIEGFICEKIFQNSKNGESARIQTRLNKQNVRFTSGELFLMESEQQTYSGSSILTGTIDARSTYRVHLAELNPDKITVTTNAMHNEAFRKAGEKNASYSGSCVSVSVDTFNSNKVVEYESNSIGRNMTGAGKINHARLTDPKNYITFRFADKDTADRVATALRHAIALSGGKKELF